MNDGDRVTVDCEHALAGPFEMIDPMGGTPKVQAGAVGVIKGTHPPDPTEIRPELSEFRLVEFDVGGTPVVGVIHESHLKPA
jgi:hypothetical protein